MQQPTYYKCHNCNMVTSSMLWILDDNNGFCCPNCLKAGSSTTWPNEQIRQLFSSIINLKSEIIEYGQVACVLYVAAVRSMIEDLVRTIALGDLLYEEAGHLIDTMISLNSGHEKLLRLLEELSYDCFSYLIDDSVEDAFYPTFLRLTKIRDHLIYGHDYQPQELDPDYLQSIIGKTILLFSELNNEFHPQIAYRRIEG